MNMQRLMKAIDKQDIKTMAHTALAAATDLPEDVKTKIMYIVGAAYLATDEDKPEPNIEPLRTYLKHVRFAAMMTPITEDGAA